MAGCSASCPLVTSTSSQNRVTRSCRSSSISRSFWWSSAKPLPLLEAVYAKTSFDLGIACTPIAEWGRPVLKGKYRGLVLDHTGEKRHEGTKEREDEEGPIVDQPPAVQLSGLEQATVSHLGLSPGVQLALDLLQTLRSLQVFHLPNGIKVI
ncbi:hypothetical protein EYF80_035368 [Liparis tanakae]|uniref:Uncharacterized protein n=1 Tax=Liparis tanakae TaxID=230148 RepID=A0A4Z2GMB4_9TELE|nr:hypothetical protein EYF80_035368 [Liparis tanakae]